MATLAEDRPRQGLVERILVRVRDGAHGLNERLAREGAVGEIVGAIVRIEDADLFVSPPETELASAQGNGNVVTIGGRTGIMRLGSSY